MPEWLLVLIGVIVGGAISCVSIYIVYKLDTKREVAKVERDWAFMDEAVGREMMDDVIRQYKKPTEAESYEEDNKSISDS